MEDPVPYGDKPNQTFTVYKFDVDPDNPEIFMVHSWDNLTYKAAQKLIPDNYQLSNEATIKSNDYYLVVHLKSWEDNICNYYVKSY